MPNLCAHLRRSQLLSLDESSVRDALHARYGKRKIYTYINNLLVAVNPYQLLPIYGEDMLEQYTQYGAQHHVRSCLCRAA